MSIFAPALYLILALSILVLVHEWGHYIVARRTGVRVLKFSIGFGPELLGTTRGETRWCVSLIPFGGYVKFAGDNPEETRDGATDEFLSQSVGVRSAIVLAGPVMNYILAIVLFACVLYFAGEPVAHSTKIGEVVDGSVAESIGIRAGDVIRSVNGTPVEDWESFTHELYLIGPGQDYRFEMERGDKRVEIKGRTGAGKGFGMESPLGVVYHRDAVMGYVKRGDPAWNAGLRRHDRILQYDGRTGDRWADFADYVMSCPGKEIALTWGARAPRCTGSSSPKRKRCPTRAASRRRSGPSARSRSSRRGESDSRRPSAARGGAAGLTSRVLEFVPRLPVMVAKGLGRLVTGHGRRQRLGGPLRMAEMFGRPLAGDSSASRDDGEHLHAARDLQPAAHPRPGRRASGPPPRGGRARRTPSLRVKVILQQIGFALLVLLMLSVTMMDVGRALG